MRCFIAMKIHVSQYAKAALDEFPEYQLELRGQTEVKVISILTNVSMSLCYRHLGYERVYLPLGKVADTPFNIQGDDDIMYF